MHKLSRFLLVFTIIIAISLSILFAGCSKLTEDQPAPGASQNTAENISGAGNGDTAAPQSGSADVQQPKSTVAQAPESTKPPIDLNTVKPDESGKIMVVMFHRFITVYEKGDKDYTTTFDEFRKLLNTLYDSGYRLISLNDYINGKIDTPAGFIPMVFTFDDGTAGQFNLVEENGALKANKDSAVGIMEEFNKTHPDFGLKGTFFVNLGDNTFSGAGTLVERLKYLTDEGFQIGNHTYTHVDLKKDVKTSGEIEKEIGENQSKMNELMPGYTMSALALPNGSLPAEGLRQYVEKGEYEGTQYLNKGIMNVGWDPTYSPFSAKLNLLLIDRVRASGIAPVEYDLAWWLQNMKRDKQFVSDGNPDTVTIPKEKEADIDQAKLNGRKLVTY